jgi:tetratricopeptide (TPR) repeat protein
MKPLVLILSVTSILLAGCGTLNKEIADSPVGNILKSSENERVYRAGYDRTFRASVDTLRQLDNGSAKLVRYNEGIIVFQEPNDSGSINVDVSRVDAEATRVVLSATKARKYWFDESDKRIRDQFFEALDKRLNQPPPPSEEAKESVELKTAAESVKAAENAPAQTDIGQKLSLIEKLTAELRLKEENQFLQKLSYEELLVLDHSLDSLENTVQKQRDVTGKCAACYIDLARVYHDSGQYARAAQALKAGIAVDPENAIAHCNLGEIYKHLNLIDDAVRELNTAKTLNAQLPDVYINLGIIYDDFMADDQKALECYRQYVTLGGSNQQVQEWITAIEKGS